MGTPHGELSLTIRCPGIVLPEEFDLAIGVGFAPGVSVDEVRGLRDFFPQLEASGRRVPRFMKFLVTNYILLRTNYHQPRLIILGAAYSLLAGYQPTTCVTTTTLQN